MKRVAHEELDEIFNTRYVSPEEIEARCKRLRRKDLENDFDQFMQSFHASFEYAFSIGKTFIREDIEDDDLYDMIDDHVSRTYPNVGISKRSDDDTDVTFTYIEPQKIKIK